MAKEKSLEVDDMVAKWSKELPMIEDRFVSTRYLALDYAFGEGLPENRIISVYSEPGVGKSLLALCLALGVLNSIPDSVVLYCDVERGLSGVLLRNIFGADYEEKYRNRLVIVSPDSYESAIEVIMDFIRTKKLKLIVTDSLSALQCADDIKRQADGENFAVGKKSRTEGEFLNFLKTACAASNFAALFINQVTADFGGSSWTGPSKKMKGSNALPHYSSVIWRMQSAHSEKNDKGEFVSAVVKITNVKNRLCGNRIAFAHFLYGHGISNIRTIAEFFKWSRIISQKGAWFVFQEAGFDFGQGMGQPVQVQGIDEVERLIKAQLSQIVEYCKNTGKLEEFFNAYIYK